MKRKYADTLRSSSAMSEPSREISTENARLARAETLLREANRDRISEVELQRANKQAVLLEAAREDVRKQGKQHSIHQTFVREDKDGEMKFETVVFQEATAEIVRLMDEPQPLLTGLTWSGMTTPERATMLKTLGFPSSIVFAESVLDVLPELSKTHVLDWQRQINAGGAWSGSLSVGLRAEALIEQGFLLYGKEVSTGAFHDVQSRTSIQGRPGSVSFVQAVMGKPYLEWLLANEQHPIET